MRASGGGGSRPAKSKPVVVKTRGGRSVNAGPPRIAKPTGPAGPKSNTGSAGPKGKTPSSGPRGNTPSSGNQRVTPRQPTGSAGQAIRPIRGAKIKAKPIAGARLTGTLPIHKYGYFGRLKSDVDAILSGKVMPSQGLSKFLDQQAQAIGGGIGAVAAGPTRLTVKKSKGAVPVAAVAPAQVNLTAEERKRLGRFGANAIKDTVDLPASIIPSLYLPGKHLAEGKPGTAAKDIYGGYEQLAKDPAKMASEHPVLTAAMLYGLKAGIGRGAGAAMRRGVAGEAGKRAASTEAPHRMQVVPGTSIADKRPYPKDIIDKGLVVASEKMRGVDRNPKTRVVMKNRGQRIRAYEQMAKAEDVRRVAVPKAVQEGRKAASAGGEKPTAQTTLAAQGLVNFTVGDLKAYRKQIAMAIQEIKGDPRHTQDVASYEANLKLINEAIKSPRDSAKLKEAATAYAKFNREQQRQLEDLGITGAGQSERATQIAYAAARMGARKTRDGELIDRSGHPLTEADIKAHMAASGGLADAAFVSHVPNMRRPANFYVNPSAPGGFLPKNRTGLAAARGTMDVHPDVLEHQTAKAQGLIVQAQEWADANRQFAIRAKNRKTPSTFGTRTDAQRAGQAYTAATGVQVRVVRMDPFGSNRARTEALMEDARTPEHAISQHMHELVSDALEPKSGEGPFVLWPEQIAKAYADNASRGATTGSRVGNTVGTLWRKNVLSFSPKWLAGNFGEAGLRTAVLRATPADLVFGRRYLAALEQLDPALMAEARARSVAGGHYSLGTRNNVHTDAQHFASAPDFLRDLAQGLGRARRMPVGKQAYGLWKVYTDAIFAINGMIESQFQTAMLGKALRDLGYTDRRFLDVSTKAVEAAVTNASDTNAFVELGRFVDRAYGKYGKYSPEMRRAIATWTPFVAWTLNAVRFLFHVLPADHPVLTGLLASANASSEEWRKAVGQKVDPRGGTTPLYLQSGVPGADGSVLRLGRYTPTGIMTAEGGPLGAFSSAFAPQLGEILNNAIGLDWRGRPLSQGGGRDDLQRNALAVLTSVLESTIPFTSQVEGVSGVRLPNMADNTVIPDTLGGRVRKQFDPFMYAKGSGAGGGSAPVTVRRKGGSQRGLPAPTGLRQSNGLRQSPGLRLPSGG